MCTGSDLGALIAFSILNALFEFVPAFSVPSQGQHEILVILMCFLEYANVI